MEFTDHNGNKENMARFLKPRPSPGTGITGIAERRMRALREQQRQEILANQATSRASTREECMDVDMDECSSPLPIEEKMDCSSEDDILPSTAAVKLRVNSLPNHHSNFAEKLNPDTLYDFYVVDTCVYIDALEGVEALLMYCLDIKNHSVLVVPYQVLKELDNIKARKPALAETVEAASRFIRNNLECNHRAIKAQHTNDYMQRFTGDQSGDDSILDCALQLQEEVPNVGTITMVTHDSILRTKAVAAKLGETTMNRLLSSLPD